MINNDLLRKQLLFFNKIEKRVVKVCNRNLVFHPKMSRKHFMQIMTLSEIHIKWKHFKALLPMELNVRSIDNINVNLDSES